jgi:hypothetical protein
MSALAEGAYSANDSTAARCILGLTCGTALGGAGGEAEVQRQGRGMGDGA